MSECDDGPFTPVMHDDPSRDRLPSHAEREEGVQVRYFEDFKVGDRFSGGPVEVREDEVIAFAKSFDPQPFHVDPIAAKDSLFGTLVTSGWHTAALTMRMIAESDIRPAGGTIGFHIQELRWPRAVRPGDMLRFKAEVLAARPSSSRPDSGIVKMRYRTLNQHGDEVMTYVVVQIVRRQPRD